MNNRTFRVLFAGTSSYKTNVFQNREIIRWLRRQRSDVHGLPSKSVL